MKFFNFSLFFIKSLLFDVEWILSIFINLDGDHVLLFSEGMKFIISQCIKYWSFNDLPEFPFELNAFGLCLEDFMY